MVKIFSDKKGWIEILEAFISVMLVVAILLIAIDRGNNASEDVSRKVYSVEVSILREVQTNDSLREEIAGIENSTIPVEWDFFPQGLKGKIIERTPNYLVCIGKICNLDTVCVISERKDKSVYSQSVIISSTLMSGIVYRKLNLFCWQKG
jgi:hypothetical protein